MLDLIHPHGTGLRDPQAIPFQGGVMFSFTPLALFGRRFCRG
ncbi:hypothetical protein Acife_0023 [Acidithiobacillus ferrivorans SS3]|uniref:Uncharacterized protein n=1 Tax=Acidithiobacillus ferrivorans SS3 TaxID=743299 RepID=G0JPN1_9PROT|nr:hypothetical protein Acife_0023 [Acidithiobacillus ferrivorans SS3]